MCAKISQIILILVHILMHACDGRSLAATTSILDQKSHPSNKEGSLKSSMSYSPNRVLSKNAANFNTQGTEDICKRNRGTKARTSVVFSRSEDCISSHHEALLQYSTKSEGSRWPHVNVRKMDMHTPFSREEDLSETDYQPPHRKAPIHNK